MTSPELAASRFLLALGIGAVLGLVYGFLRPLRPRLTHLADLLFVVICFLAWIFLCFGLCLGDLRLGYTVGMFLGGFGWEMSIGRLLRPVWRGFWHFLAFFLQPIKKLFALLHIFCKKLLAKCQKWAIIERSIGCLTQRRKTNGGTAHGKTQISFCIEKEQHACKGRDSGHNPAVHHCADHSTRHHRAKKQRI